MINAKSKSSIFKFVKKQITENYKDIVLILCDIKFYNDCKRGNEIVTHIRQLKNLSPSNWASMVPIIGMTEFSDNETSLEEIIRAGADYAFDKQILDESEDLSEEKDKVRAIIETQIRKFQKNLESIYPDTLKDEIIARKNEYGDRKTAFIMSAFRHKEYIDIVKDILEKHGIIPLITDGPVTEFDDKVWDNIVIHMNVCDFGISIYADDSLDNNKDSKERDKMNPNVSIETGYLLGLQKKVLFLKHDNLPKLPSDFGGEHYKSFHDYTSLKTCLDNWLLKRGFSEKLGEKS